MTASRLGCGATPPCKACRGRGLARREGMLCPSFRSCVCPRAGLLVCVESGDEGKRPETEGGGGGEERGKEDSHQKSATKIYQRERARDAVCRRWLSCLGIVARSKLFRAGAGCCVHDEGCVHNESSASSTSRFAGLRHHHRGWGRTRRLRTSASRQPERASCRRRASNKYSLLLALLSLRRRQTSRRNAFAFANTRNGRARVAEEGNRVRLTRSRSHPAFRPRNDWLRPPALHAAARRRMRFALVCIYCCRGSTAFTVPPQVVSFACGGVAGALGAVVVYPLDYVKTVLQTREGASTYRNGAHAFRSIVSDTDRWLFIGVSVRKLLASRQRRHSKSL